MKTSKTIPAKETTHPTTPRVEVDMDELAKLWIEIVLKQVRKSPVVSLKNSSYNNVIGLLNSR